jgi:hypothetical protein
VFFVVLVVVLFVGWGFGGRPAPATAEYDRGVLGFSGALSKSLNRLCKIAILFFKYSFSSRNRHLNLDVRNFVNQGRKRISDFTIGSSSMYMKLLSPDVCCSTDWVGVDLEDSPGENLAEKAISAGGNYVGASTLAARGYIKWPELWGALG